MTLPYFEVMSWHFCEGTNDNREKLSELPFLDKDSNQEWRCQKFCKYE
jgi:hypothetical protein